MDVTPLPKLIEICAQYDQYFRGQRKLYDGIKEEIVKKPKHSKKDKGELAVCNRELNFNSFCGAMNAMMIDVVKHVSEVKGIDLGLDTKPEGVIVSGEFNKGDSDE